MNSLNSPEIARILAREHAAARQQGMARRAMFDAHPDTPHPSNLDFRTSEIHRTSYPSIGPDQGRWPYGMAIAANAREIVEFGSSFGISTIYLAAAAAENGGRVTGSECHAAKAEKARANLKDAGLDASILVGDALDTLSAPGPRIDLLFLDGAKELYLPVLDLMHPRLHRGSLVIADNVPVTREEREQGNIAAFGDFLHDDESGFVSTVLAFGKGGMSFSVKL